MKFMRKNISILIAALSVLIASSIAFAAKPSSRNQSCGAVFNKNEISALRSDARSVLAALPDYAIVPNEILNFDIDRPRDSIPIAEALIERFQSKEREWLMYNKIRKKKINLDTESEILLFFPSSNILPIAKNGFANYHQTSTTNGGHRNRSEEDHFLGLILPHTPQADILRAKSAYLNVKKKVNLGVGAVAVHERFGGIAAKLKDQVKKRSLVANDDTLAIAQTFQFPQILRHLTTFNSQFLSMESIAVHDYNEVLTFGAIDLTDVEYFLVAEGALTQDELTLLRSFGIPVYAMTVERIFNRYVYGYTR